MNKNFSYKTFFKNYGIVVGYLVIIFGLLIYVTKVSQKFWQNNLQKTTQIVLDEYNKNEWTVGNSIRIKNPISQSAACYETRNKKDGEIYKSIIIRVQTLYGPVPAVFIIDKENKVEFIGYSNVHGTIQKQILTHNNNKRIAYWINKIPEIIE